MDHVHKGRRFEQNVAKKLRDGGVQASRIVTARGRPGDVVQGCWLLECKSSVRPEIRAALEQCEDTLASDRFAERGINRAAAVVKKTGDRRGPIVALRLDDWIDVHRRLEELERQAIVVETLDPHGGMAQAGGR